MCGIAGIHLKRPGIISNEAGLENFVDHLLLGNEKRGPHATGFVATTFGEKRRTVADKAAVTATDFIKTRDRIPANVQTILLHTRYATKGDKANHLNNHPVLHKTCFAIHNGHINNDDELFESYGLPRYGEVDSEIIPALAHHVGLDDPTEWLSKFEGYMATALIDPVNFPGRLVIAKGKWSPLYSFENGNFIVWSSELQAIKDAWGHVLGTPPKANKFRYWKEGEILTFDDGIKTESSFQVAPYIKQHSSTKKDDDDNEHGNWGGFGYGAPPVGELPRTADPAWWKRPTQIALPITAGPSALDDNTKRELAVRAIVRAARSQDAGWIATVPMAAMTDATKEEIYELYPQLESLKWVTCSSCETFVLDVWMQKTLRWGKICIDCHGGNIRYYQRKAQIAAEADEVAVAHTTTSKVEWIEPETVAKLTEFLNTELELHTEALAETAGEVNLDIRIVDWLVFRAPESYLENHPLLADVAEEFDNIYQEFMEALWQEKGEGLRAPDSREPALSYCTEHGQYHAPDQNCADCELDSQWAAHKDKEQKAWAFPTVGGLGIEGSLAKPIPPVQDVEMTVCECGKFTTDVRCITCKNATANEELNPAPRRLALAPGPQPVGLPPRAATPGRVDQVCVTCGSGAEFVVPKQGWAWCVDCFVGCGVSEGGVPCSALCNHTEPDGIRICHSHSRGRQAIADTLLKKEFGEFIELGRF